MNRILVNEYYVTIIADSTDKDFLHFLSFAATADILVDKQRSRDTYNCSLRALPEILKMLRPTVPVESMPEIFRRKYYKEITRRERTALLKQYGPDNTHPFLWTHQQLGVELAEVNDRYGFFYDTRTGKTMMSYQIMLNALRNGAKRAVVICPSAIIKSWKDDAKQFPQLKVAAYYGDSIDKANALRTPCHIMLWSMEIAADCLNMLKAAKFDLCFVDESSKLKNRKSKISEAMLELSREIPRWYCLSATPAPNGEYEYYTQIKCIDPYAFPDAVGHFENRYFNDLSRNKNYKKLVIKPELKQSFMDMIAEYSIYVDQSVMPTAGKEWFTVGFELPTELKQYYDRMRTEMYAEVGGVTITADMAAAMRAKLNQITSGFIMDTDAIKENKLNKLRGTYADEKERYRLSDYRIDELDTLLKSFGDKKVVIWANYQEEFEMIEDLLGTRARYIRGGCGVRDKEAYIDLFRNGNLQYLVCHPLSIGMGNNFTVSHTVVYYSMTDSWEALKQSSERVAGHISVQPNKCQYYIMLAKGSVDELIYDNVTHKRDDSTGFLNHLEARFNVHDEDDCTGTDSQAL